MQVTPESQDEITKGVVGCFFELESMCQHIESEFEKCPNIECELYKPRNPMINRD